MILKKPKLTIKKDLDAVLKFLEETNYDVKELIRLLDQFKILTKREKETKDEKELKNVLTAQIRIFDRILKIYAMFELDADINGERVKNIGKLLSNKAEKIGISDELMQKMKTAEEWTYDW